MSESKSPQIIWDIPGGVHLEEHKDISNQTPIQSLPLFNQYVIPVAEKSANNKDIQVNVGDHVYKGQLLAVANSPFESNIHAPTSGKISAIKSHPVPHPGGCQETCIVLDSDFHDMTPESTDSQSYKNCDNHVLIDLIREYGVNGLGGAGFPTGTKLKAHNPIDTIVINGVECEPYITCDDRLMRENANEIVEGAKLAQQITSASKVIIAIEDNKPQAIEAMRKSCQSHTDFEVLVLPTKYPSGSEKQLFFLATGIEVPKGKLPQDVGLLMINVGTCYAIKQAIVNNMPLIERVTTITGNAANQPGNYLVRIGTKLSDLIQHFDITNYQQIIFGGPMMGYPVENLATPLSKTINCVIFAGPKELNSSRKNLPCIRCGDCQSVCPVELLPQQLLFFSKNQQHEKAVEHNIFDCIECGACSYVCPSDIPLVDYYRTEKSQIRRLEAEKKQAEHAKVRFEKRNARLERIQQEREAKRLAVKLEREQALKEKEQKQEQAITDTEEVDPKKAAIAAALARVQAKKQAKQNTETSSADTQTAQHIDSSENNESNNETN